MWSATGAEPVRRRRGTSSSTLEQLIDERRQHLVSEREAVPSLQGRARALRAHAESLTRRFEMRMRRDTLLEAEGVEREAAIRVSRRREVEFEVITERYLREYARVVTSPSVETASTTDSPHPKVRRIEEAETDAASTRVITAPGSSVHQTIDCFVQRARLHENAKHAIVHEYMADVENRPSRLSLRARDVCPFCNVSLHMNAVKSILVCETCGYSVVHFDSTIQTMSYSDDYDFSSFSYKRISHFEDCMRQIQGKETFVVPDEIITAVMQRFASERLRLEDITQSKVRDALKALRQRRAYDHVAQVYMRIAGKRPPRVSVQMEEACRSMFVRMQPIFEKHCPKTRKNFLSYNYVLFRLFHILGLEYMLGSFALLKGKEKLYACDDIFERIAKDLDWKFEPIDQIMSRITRS